MKTNPGSRWYCLFLGYYSEMSDSEVQKLSRACSRFVKQVVLGDHRVFFEVDLSRPFINLGTLQFKIQSFAETWGLPFHVWQWGVGKTLAESWVQTRWKSLAPDFLPIEVLDDFAYPLASPLGASPKSGLGAATFNLLRCLGYQTLADLGDMPHDLLLARLDQVLSDSQVQNAVADPNGPLQDNWLATLTELSFLDTEPGGALLEIPPVMHEYGEVALVSNAAA